MSYQHKNLAAGRWKELTLFEQMAHIGGEVERALSWQAKSNADYSLKAFERALELIDLTMEWPRSPAHLREMTRLREALADYFYGTNEFKSTESSWKKYFSCFIYAARKNH